MTNKEIKTLKWFVAFVSSGQMESKKWDDTSYFWVNYNHAALGLNFSIHQIEYYFKQLCINKLDIVPPLIKKTISLQETGGRRTYFAINLESPFLQAFLTPEQRKDLKQMKAVKFFEVPKTLPGITPEVLRIIEKLTKMTVREGEDKKLFSTRIPKDRKPTKTIQAIEQKILAIYNGAYSKWYLRKICFDFIDRNRNLIDIEDSTKRLERVKWNWVEVERLITKAALRYQRWFWKENEPMSKDWLTRDISKWLFDDNYGKEQSLFSACLLSFPCPISDFFADKIFDTLPDSFREVADKFYQPEWMHMVGYWTKMKNMNNFYNLLHDLQNEEPNIKYWIQGGRKEWLTSYFAWLRDFTGNNVFYKNVGIDCPTWNVWFEEFTKKYDSRIIKKLKRRV